MAKKKSNINPKGKKEQAVPAKNPIKRKKSKLVSGLNFDKGFWSKNGIAAAILFLLAMALYATTINFEYVLDDQIVLTKNNYVKKGLGGLGDIFGKESMSGYFDQQRDLVVGARYRPLSIATFAIEYEFFKVPSIGADGNSTYTGNSKVSHFINILLYGLTALLLFRVLTVFIKEKKERPWFFSISFLASLFFVLHPIHSEVIANVKGRDEILAFIGALATLFYALKYAKTNSMLSLVLAMVIFFISLLAKENSLTFIAVVPLVLYLFSNTDFNRIGKITGALTITAVLYLLLRYQVIGYFLSSGKEIRDIMNNPFYGLDFSEKFGTIFYTLALYIKLLVFPHPLTHDYYPFHIPVLGLFDFRSLIGIVLNLGLVFIAFKTFKKGSILCFGILFYFITLSIVSNIPFTVGTFMNERFVYFGSLGFCLILAWLIVDKIPEWLKIKEGEANILGYGLLGLFVIGFGLKTIERVPAWATPLTLNAAAIKISKNSARANCFYATALFQEYKVMNPSPERNALLDEITIYVDRAMEINPRYGSAITMKSGVIAEQYKRDNDVDKLLNEFYKILVIRRSVPFIDQYLDYLIDRVPAKKISDFSIKSADALIQQNDFNNAMKYLTKYGVNVNSGDANVNYKLGKLYERVGDAAKAQTYLTRARQINPSLQ